MPIRTIPMSYRSITGRLCAAGRQIAFESTLERDFAILQAFDPEVVELEEQPVRITYVQDGRTKAYTPDFLVRSRRRRPRLVEVKYAAELESKKAQLKSRFAAARRFAAEQGWVFEVVTESKIRSDRLDNSRFLLPFRQRRIDPKHIDEVISAVRQLQPITVEELLASVAGDARRGVMIPCVWHLVATGRLAADLCVPLDMNSIVREA